MFSVIKAGMATAKHQLSIISNNVANANTNGFKKTLASYSDIAPSSLSDSIRATSSGLGSLVEDSRLSHTQRTLLDTEKTTDLGLAGDGFFIVKNPSDNSYSYTRNGMFSINENGYLMTNDSCFVMGTPLVDGQYATAPATIEELLPIQIPARKDNNAMSELEIAEDGQISAQYGQFGGELPRTPIATLALGLFTNPEGLLSAGAMRYHSSEKAGAFQVGNPTDSGFAAVKSGSLEMSNVDITDELTSMLQAQQQFNGAARLMQTSSEMVEKLTR